MFRSKLYEVYGIPTSPLMGEPPSYAEIYDAADWGGLAPFSDHSFGLMPGDLRLWGQAEYWTAVEAALLLAGVSPVDPELYAIVRETELLDGAEDSHYAWKYSWMFRRAGESLFLFERSSLAPAARPIEWVKYYEQNVRRIFDVSKFTPEYIVGWLEYFRAELAVSSTVGEPAQKVDDNPGRRERQWDVMRAVCAALKFDPLQIPDGGCAELKSACLSLPLLFTDEGFEHAWKAGKKKNLFKMANREKFSPK